jgi:hypothetical protein
VDLFVCKPFYFRKATWGGGDALYIAIIEPGIHRTLFKWRGQRKSTESTKAEIDIVPASGCTLCIIQVQLVQKVRLAAVCARCRGIQYRRNEEQLL